MSVNAIETRATKSTVGKLVSRFILKPLATWRARQLAMNELLALDDHMLSDIGISRGEIPGIVSGRVKPRRATNENRPHQVA